MKKNARGRATYQLPPKVRAAIGARIRLHRERLDLSARQLSNIVGKAYSTILDTERGRIAPSVFTLYRYASVLNCTVYDLLPMKGPTREVRIAKKA